jgi:hypothetical protein
MASAREIPSNETLSCSCGGPNAVLEIQADNGTYVWWCQTCVNAALEILIGKTLKEDAEDSAKASEMLKRMTKMIVINPEISGREMLVPFMDDM